MDGNCVKNQTPGTIVNYNLRAKQTNNIIDFRDAHNIYKSFPTIFG